MRLLRSVSSAFMFVIYCKFVVKRRHNILFHILWLQYFNRVNYFLSSLQKRKNLVRNSSNNPKCSQVFFPSTSSIYFSDRPTAQKMFVNLTQQLADDD